MTVLFQPRHQTAANWTSDNPTLLMAEKGYETDTGKWKTGDGVTAWNSLGYDPHGTGDVTGQSSSVDSEVALFSSTTGKVIKRATGSGLAKVASGVFSTVSAPSGTVVGTSDSQALTNKDLTGSGNTFPTLNQDTTGKAAKADALNSATTAVNVAAATAPTTGQVLTATDSTHATWQAAVAAVAWGAITGTLASQTDLSTALAAKLAIANNLSDITDQTTARWNLRISWQFRAIAVATTNQTLSGTVTIDGVALVANNRVLLTGQSTASQNGLWAVQSGAWTRPNDFPSAGVTQACVVLVAGGTVYANSIWVLNGTGSITIDTGSQTWTIANSTVTQALTNKDLTSGTNTFPTLNQNTSGTAANLSGTPALPNGTTATTQTAADNSTKLATTAYADTALALKAPIASPTFTGTVTLPSGLTGLAKVALGVVSAVTAPTGAVVGTTDIQTLTSKTLTAPTINSAVINTPTGIVKGDVGLGNVDNTSDATKNSATATVSNKRRTLRVNAQTSTSTLTPEIDTYDVFRLTAQAAALTIANHSTSTPTDGEQMRISILDNGTARAISFGTNYVARGGVALPTTTVISKLMTLGFEWYAHLSKWVLLASASEA